MESFITHLAAFIVGITTGALYLIAVGAATAAMLWACSACAAAVRRARDRS